MASKTVYLWCRDCKDFFPALPSLPLNHKYRCSKCGRSNIAVDGAVCPYCGYEDLWEEHTHCPNCEERLVNIQEGGDDIYGEYLDDY